MQEPLATADTSVISGAVYEIYSHLKFENQAVVLPAIMRLRFFDAEGGTVTAPTAGFAELSQGDLVRSITMVGGPAPFSDLVTFRAPQRAVRLHITIKPMPAVQMTVVEHIKIQLAPVGDQNAAQVMAVSHRLVAQDLLDVTGHDEVTLTLYEASGSTPIQDAATVAVQALDAAGNALALPPTIHRNDAYGPCVTAQPDGNRRATAIVPLPDDAAQLSVQVLQWSKTGPNVLKSVTAYPSLGPVQTKAQAELKRGSDLLITCPITPSHRRANQPAAVLEIRFLDRFGGQISDAVDGFKRSLTQWDRKDCKADTTPFVARITPPELARTLVCRVRAMGADRILASVGPIQIIPVEDINNLPWQTEALSGLPPLPSPLASHLAKGLTKVICAHHVRPKAGYLEIRAEGRLPLMFWPWIKYRRSGWQQKPSPLLFNDPLRGHLTVSFTAPDDLKQIATIALPENVERVAILALVTPDADASCTRLILRDVEAEDVVMPNGLLQDPRQNHCIFGLANALGDLEAQAAALRPLATSQEANKNIRRQFQHLNDLTQVWSGSWKPDAAPPFANRAVDPDSLFWLAPLNLNADAFRRQALMSERSSQSHWVGRLSERAGVEEEQDRDGITQDTMGTITRHKLLYTALDPRQIPAKDRLLLELRLWQRLLHTTRASVVIAGDDPWDQGRALAGLMLARAEGLPFVWDRTAFCENTWTSNSPSAAALQSRRYSHMRLAQEKRLMAEADLVLAPGLAFAAKLRQQGLRENRLRVVPQGTDARALGTSQSRIALGTSHLPKDANLVGVLCLGLSQEDLEQTLAALDRAAYPRDMHVVLIDALNSPNLQKATSTGPLVGVERLGWLDICEVIIAPRPSKSESLWTPPFGVHDAMARLRPVLLANSPTLREIAGDSNCRALSYNPDDPKSLGTALKSVLRNPSHTKARSSAAQSWAASHLWGDSRATLEAALEIARHHHSQGQS
jgi:hypothetical protein